jgi:hypothetical protein
MIQNGDKFVATLKDQIGNSELREEGDVVYSRLRYKRMDWSHTAALMRLQGAHIQYLLGDRFILLAGSHRPDYAPNPGMDDVEVGFVLENPDQLDPTDLFVLMSG